MECFRGVVKHQAIDVDEPPPFREGSSVPLRRGTSCLCFEEVVTQLGDGGEKISTWTTTDTGENTMQHGAQM